MEPSNTIERGGATLKKTKVSIEMLESATEAAREAKTSDELRMAQAVLIPGLLSVPDRVTGKIIGRSRVTVVGLRKKFGGLKSQDRNWGGRRYRYMGIDQERQFLSNYLEQASHGGILVVSEIKRAFEALSGHKVAQTDHATGCWTGMIGEQLFQGPDIQTATPRPRRALKKLPKTVTRSVSEKWHLEPVSAIMPPLWKRHSNLVTENKCCCSLLR